MSKNLVIVESPAKCRAINRYLGEDFEVLASYGHVRDLVAKTGAVDPDKNFEMKYEAIDRNAKHVSAIAKKMRAADVLYLATDPDREGEAISWHLCELLKGRRVIGDKPVRRIVFHEITRSAVREALASPRELSKNLVDAQQARRALDHLVGFNLSPLLWRKITRGLSAGRVQSPALRLIVEREREIKEFKRREYWTIDARLKGEHGEFVARLSAIAGDKLDKFSVGDAERAEEVRAALEAALKNGARIEKIETKSRKRNPAPPFITSTLQQEAARKLGFSAARTMSVAQRLYEGHDGEDGLITYMRTDSVALSRDAVRDMRAYVTEHHGADRIPEQPRVYKSKVKNAQEAHEAIRPTQVSNTPAKLKSRMDRDQWRLYDLIWKRAIASQMVHALIDVSSVTLTSGEYVLSASGSTVRDPGFTAVYEEERPDKEDKDKERRLPELSEGETVASLAVEADQHFTEPPPRYSEASLVKTLEQYGIGRPSTYAQIISTLQAREYVEMEKKRFIPTHKGVLVGDFLIDHFPMYVDYEFTAKLEDALDGVSRGEKEWRPLMDEFWREFKKRVDHISETLSRDDILQVRELGTDPKTGRPVTVRYGRFGPFVQAGSREDEEKPVFASLRKEQSLDTITLEEALELLKLPRVLGETPDGDEVRASIGRFGPYVQYGKNYVSLKEDDPHTVSLERALELIEERKRILAERVIQNFEDEGVQVLKGRYGPYVTDGEKNMTVPADIDAARLSLEECRELLKSAKPRRRKTAKKKTVKKKARTQSE